MVKFLIQRLLFKSKLDFLKLDNGKLGAINFNNMIPVTTFNIQKIDLDKKIVNKKDDAYVKLLRKQLFWLNRNKHKLYQRAEKLYDKYMNGTLDESIMVRCCNFKVLEGKCMEYNNQNQMVNI